MEGGEGWTVERYFEGSSTGYGIYVQAERMASGLGPMEVRVSKSQVSFRRRRGFAYLWRPGAYVKSMVPVVLSLALPFQAASPRFKQIAHPAPNIWMHHLELVDVSQLDDEVQQWMRQAYESAA